MPSETNKNQNQNEEKKLVNLCEDMNPHEHNQESYDKMIAERDK